LHKHRHRQAITNATELLQRTRLPLNRHPVGEPDALSQGCWPEPEVALNVNAKELGDLKLSDDQENAIVAFLKTLTDGYFTP
jgi:hypothetical protein